MRASIRTLALVLWILGLPFAAAGCTKEEPTQTNPTLKVPDVPPSGNGAKKMPTKK